MRRVTIMVSAALMLLAFTPAGALARHHSRHHSARHRHSRLERFGEVNRAPSSSSSSASAGSVQSFANGVLTIKLNDGSSVSGAVSRDTEVECMAPAQSQTAHEDGDGGGSGDQAGSQGDQSGEDQGDTAEQNGTQTEDQNENEAAAQNENEGGNGCSTSNFTPGTAVREAELRVMGSGNAWKKVELES